MKKNKHVNEIKECMEMFLEQGVDFWHNGAWASDVVRKLKKRYDSADKS